MQFLFKLLFGKGTATSIASFLFFANPNITYNNGAIVIEGSLNGVFTSQVERIINTGTEVTITYDISLIIDDSQNKILKNKKIEHIIKYDNLENMYRCTIDNKKYSIVHKEDAYKHIQDYHISIDYAPAISGKKIIFYIEAAINYSSSLQMEIPDNALWDYYIPHKKIRNIRIKENQ